MEKAVLDVPGMYGDHHVLAVRDLLGQIAGVEDIFATSAFKQVVVTYDPAKAKPEDFESVLAAQGYTTGDGEAPVEQPVPQRGHAQFVVASGVAETVRFTAPPVNFGVGGPRPCPGFEFRTFAGGGHPGDE